MTRLGQLLLILAAITTLLAIWAPAGAWWQWAITALLLLLTGAGILGRKDQP